MFKGTNGVPFSQLIVINVQPRQCTSSENRYRRQAESSDATIGRRLFLDVVQLRLLSRVGTRHCHHVAASISPTTMMCSLAVTRPASNNLSLSADRRVHTACTDQPYTDKLVLSRLETPSSKYDVDPCRTGIFDEEK